jgi:hypothetical protein
MHSLFKANEAAYLIKQREDEPNVKFYERFCETIETAESYGATFGLDGNSYQLDDIYSGLTEEEKEDEVKIQAAKERTREAYLAYMFIYRLDHARYAGLKKEFAK